MNSVYKKAHTDHKYLDLKYKLNSSEICVSIDIYLDSLRVSRIHCASVSPFKIFCCHSLIVNVVGRNCLINYIGY